MAVLDLLREDHNVFQRAANVIEVASSQLTQGNYEILDSTAYSSRFPSSLLGRLPPE